MKRNVRACVPVAILLTACVVGPKVSKAPTAPAEVSSSEVDDTDTCRRAAKSVEVVWTCGDGTEDEAERLAQLADTAWLAYEELLGRDRMPERHVIVRLAGDGDAAKGIIPRVDVRTGEVILVRFPGPGGEYEASLSHELLHAIRFAWLKEIVASDETVRGMMLFVEEGIAELLAHEIGLPSRGFPLYGTAGPAAAGMWEQHGEHIPLPTLIDRQQATNMHCSVQAYTLRLSFFMFLRERFGIEQILAFAFQPPPLAEDALERAFQLPRDRMNEEWHAWLRERFAADEAVQAQGQAYREMLQSWGMSFCGHNALKSLH